MLRGKRERRDDPYYCAIDVTALVAIMIFLLALFIVAAGPLHPHLPVVTLPKAVHPSSQPRASREDAIIVTIQLDGRVWLRRDLVGSTRLSEFISQSVKEGADRKIYINADKHARYGDVLEVLRAARQAGVEDVSFFAY